MGRHGFPDRGVSWFQVRPEVTRHPKKVLLRALLSVWSFQVGLAMARYPCLIWRVWPFRYSGVDATIRGSVLDAVDAENEK